MGDIEISNIEITSICNFKCPICVSCSRKKNIDENDFFQIVDKNYHLLNKNGVWLHFYGEPLVNSNFVSYVKYIKSKGAKVRVSTNGFLLDEKRRETIANSGLDYIVVSVATLDRETYKRIRGSDKLLQVVNNLLEFKQYIDKHNITMQLQAVMIDVENMNERDAFIEFFHDYGIHVAFHNFTNRSNCVHLDLSNTNKHDYSIKRGVCMGLEKRIAILSNCEVVTCFCDFEAKNTLGNLKDYGYSLKELLQNGNLEKLKEDLRKGMYKGACAECSDWIYYQENSSERYVTIYQAP